MERSRRPPPLNLTPPHSRKGSTQSTVSKITIISSTSSSSGKGGHSSARTRTTISVFEGDGDNWNTGRGMTALRVLSDFLHIIMSMILVLIMAFFLSYEAGAVGGPYGPAAVLLIVILVLDILLDFQSIGRYDKMWKGWLLVARMLFGIGYACLFIGYLAVGQAFPDDYTYWGISRDFSTPMVYIFLWILGVWDLVYCAISRRHFVSELRRYREAFWSSAAASGSGKPSFGTMRQWDDPEAGTTYPRPAVLRS